MSKKTTTITPYANGPLVVRGDFDIVDSDGHVVPTPRSTVALCRCGISTIKPFCDGTHKAIKFQTDPPLEPVGVEAPRQ
ncbi:MAG: hypothetical protein JWO10_1220 [Microbacteriaceae bacterium]|nr:hypothetical protein [Microbacteriaceae bacterium]